jgi:hypothetical protein
LSVPGACIGKRAVGVVVQLGAAPDDLGYRQHAFKGFGPAFGP